jgi:tRNA (guanine37-N1)-methyltransferase
VHVEHHSSLSVRNVTFDIITIFPNLCKGYLKDSVIKREIVKGTIKVRFHDIRKYTKNKHGKVDDTPYGGGAGMVMTPQPLFDCIQAVKKKNTGPVIYMSPKGAIFTHKVAEKLAAKGDDLILLCGRYEGIDQRVIDLCVDKEISIGKYVLTGGELPALVILDAVTRLLPEALGNEESTEEESFSDALNGKKEYPHYTKPSVFEGLDVPEILRGGNHAEIDKWRREKLG